MKVAHITHSLSGGVGNAALSLHTALNRAGVKSVLITAADLENGEDFNRAVNEWKSLVAEYPDRVKNYEMFSSPNTAFPHLRQALPGDVDILHFHWVCGIVPFDIPWPWLKDYPIAWTLHDMNPFTGGCHFSAGCDRYRHGCGDCPQLNSGRKDDHSRQIHRQKQEAYRSLNITCVSPSRWMRDNALKSSLLSDKRQVIIRNGIDLTVFSPQQKPREADGRIGENDFVLLFGSDQNSRRKGAQLLREALRIFVARYSPKHFKLATFGSQDARVASDPGIPVIPFGYIDKPGELAHIYSMADAFVLPSLDDNLPNVVSEALACGTPVVAFKVGGVPEQVEHGVTGYLAKPGDPADLAEGFAWAMGRTGNRKKTAAACRERALHFCNIEERAHDMALLYENICASRQTHNKGGLTC